MELRCKKFGCYTLEELCKSRVEYFSEELEKQTDEWWIGKCSGSRETWRFIGATLEAKGENFMPVFLAEGYMMSKLQNELNEGMDDRTSGFADGQMNVYKAVLLDIDRSDLISLVDAGGFDPEQYMANMMGR